VLTRRWQLPATARGRNAFQRHPESNAAGVRPDPADHNQYRVDRLIGDALDIVSAVGHGDRRFHLVGHDWGASLAWQIADQHPDRLASLTILSRPHPLAFARALETSDGEQRRRSGHHRTFLEPDAGPNILADNANWLRTRLIKNGVPPAVIEAHLPAGYGGSPGVVSGARCTSSAGGTDQSANLVHLGRPGRHSWTSGGRRKAVNSSPLHTSTRNFRVSATTPPTKCRRR
jgi:pimeloyl-ACP methyl ester carboxylesterase